MLLSSWRAPVSRGRTGPELRLPAENSLASYNEQLTPPFPPCGDILTSDPATCAHLPKQPGFR
jgi:hypothetical protein